MLQTPKPTCQQCRTRMILDRVVPCAAAYDMCFYGCSECTGVFTMVEARDNRPWFGRRTAGCDTACRHDARDNCASRQDDRLHGSRRFRHRRGSEFKQPFAAAEKDHVGGCRIGSILPRRMAQGKTGRHHIRRGAYRQRVARTERSATGSFNISCPGFRFAPSGLRHESCALLHARFLRREFIDRRAKLAGHDHLAVLHHVGAVLRLRSLRACRTPRRASRSIARAAAAAETRARRARETGDTAAARPTDPDRSVRRPRRSRSATGLRPRRRLPPPSCVTAPSGASPGCRSACRARSGALGRNCSSMPPARQRCLGPSPPPRHSSPTASRTRVGICSERRKYSCAASSRLPPSSATSP